MYIDKLNWGKKQGTLTLKWSVGTSEIVILLTILHILLPRVTDAISSVQTSVLMHSGEIKHREMSKGKIKNLTFEGLS